MPNIMSALKQEIQRLARKEVRTAVRPLQKDKVALKNSVRELRQQVQLLEKQNRQLSEALAKNQAVVPVVPEGEEAPRMRITVKGLRSLRRKLKLTQEEFAQLLGVSGQSVWQWEQKSGALRLRSRTKQALLEIRDLGAREVRKRLEESQPAPEAKTSNSKQKA